MSLFERLVREVRAERQRQDEKWGVQNHPMVLDNRPQDSEYWRMIADMWKRENDLRVSLGTAEGLPKDQNCAWDGILNEEMAETFAEERPGLQYAEAMQTAGVAFAILDFLNRRSKEQTGHFAACPALDVDWILTAPEACDCEVKPRFEVLDLNQSSPFAGCAWGVWDTRDRRWWPDTPSSVRSDCESVAARLNAEEATR